MYEGEAVEPERKKYLVPILAMLLLLLVIVVVPLIVAETSQQHVRKVGTISAVSPISGCKADYSGGMIRKT
jgi:hypothetical protein